MTYQRRTPTAFRIATPKEQDAMSWHQLQRYERNLKRWVADQNRQIEARKIAKESTVLPPEARAAMRELIETLTGLLEVSYAANKHHNRWDEMTPDAQATLQNNLTKARASINERYERDLAEAFRLFECGKPVYVVADRLGTSMQTANRWRREWERRTREGAVA